MRRARAHLPAVLALLLGAGAARAQAPAAPPPRAETQAVRPPEAPAPAPPAVEPRARVRSSHTVDVIAPGEKVDTILGRMKVERPTPPPRGDTVRPPPGAESREPHQRPGPGRTGGGRPGDDGRTRSPSPRTDGAPPPPSGQPPPPPPPPR
jgi:hypothetical protein